MILTQTTALLVDAYRELNARKLFWITMILNLLAVAIYASLGLNERGPTFLHWTFDSDVFNTRVFSREFFYKLQFTAWGTPVWLSWVATILALISTSGMIPDLISGGTIETVLSKPLGRVRLLLTKFVFALLFVVLQVTVFCAGCFLVLWIRGGAFTPEIFLGIPIVTAFYSYLFAVCVLLGLVTRSTIAALLLTILFWFMVFLVNTGDGIVLLQRETAVVALEDSRRNLDNQIALADRMIEQREANASPILDPEGAPITDLDARREAVNSALAASRARVPERERAVETWRRWTSRVVLVKTFLPKTQETVALLDRYLVNTEDLQRLMTGGQEFTPPDADEQPFGSDPRVTVRVEEATRGRTLLWVLGTSFAFEGVVLAIACVLFARRDF